MRITADTNVLLSSMFWLGDSYKIIQKAKNKEITLVLSEPIIEELANVLQYKEIQDKIKDKNLEMQISLEDIFTISEIIENSESISIVEDPDDNKILECALAGNVDYIVTKDNHLLKIKDFRGIKIITPEEFLNI